jgi:phosphoglycolate phosphatase-like HAD superfamily hydrolase
VPRAFAGVELPGRTDPAIVADALASHGVPPDHPALHGFNDLYFTCLADELGRGSARGQVLPGVRPLLDALAARDDFTLALLTGNFEESARLKLEHFDLWRYFACGAFGGDAADRNGLVRVALQRTGHPDPAVARIVVIGDTPHDVACAAAADARSLAVATGSASEGRLREAGADVVFADLADTSAVLAAIDQLLAVAVEP